MLLHKYCPLSNVKVLQFVTRGRLQNRMHKTLLFIQITNTAKGADIFVNINYPVFHLYCINTNKNTINC